MWRKRRLAGKDLLISNASIANMVSHIARSNAEQSLGLVWSPQTGNDSFPSGDRLIVALIKSH
jgi:hypothetical protein